MKQIKIEKLTLNIGVGQPGDKLDKAVLLLQTISNSKPVRTKTMKRIPTWGVRPKLLIGCKVTVRGEKAEHLLIRLFKANNNILKSKNFDENGNFAFGISEYINIPSVEYNPEIGIIGLEAAVTLEYPGYRIKKRKIKYSKIPARHQVTKDVAIAFIKEKFKINIAEE